MVVSIQAVIVKLAPFSYPISSNWYKSVPVQVKVSSAWKICNKQGNLLAIIARMIDKATCAKIRIHTAVLIVLLESWDSYIGICNGCILSMAKVKEQVKLSTTKYTQRLLAAF